MENNRFDQIAKTMARNTSRRRLAQGAGAGVVATVLGVAGLRAANAQDVSANARCRRSDERCQDPDDCCSLRCKKLRGRDYKTCRCRAEGLRCDRGGRRDDRACCSGNCKSNGKCAAEDED